MENLKSADTLDPRGLMSLDSNALITSGVRDELPGLTWNDVQHHARMLTTRGVLRRGVSRLCRDVTQSFFEGWLTTQIVYYEQP